ncbi:hypothetical protein MRX96_012539 [Rhipicephalus microplus]
MTFGGDQRSTRRPDADDRGSADAPRAKRSVGFFPASLRAPSLIHPYAAVRGRQAADKSWRRLLLAQDANRRPQPVWRPSG